jgi:hypothetical protein
LQQNKSKEAEVFPLVNELADIAAQYYKGGRFTVATTTVAAGTIYTSDDLPEGAVWSVSWRILGQSPTSRCMLLREAVFYRQSAGATTQEGATASPATIRTDANMSTAIAASGNAVTITVTDALARAMSWSCWVEIRVSL